jgi:hypothetical protein
MPNKEITIAGGPNNTKVMVTGQQELVVTHANSIKTPTLISTNTAGTISGEINNISISNIGSIVGTLAVNGGSPVDIPVGVTVTMDAGGNNNRFASGAFEYDTKGTTFLIAYVF